MLIYGPFRSRTFFPEVAKSGNIGLLEKSSKIELAAKSCLNLTYFWFLGPVTVPNWLKTKTRVNKIVNQQN